MPRARGDKEYRLPFKGLNTEANLLDFPQDSAVDISNLEIDLNPMRLRCRLGHTSALVGGFGTDTVGSDRGDEAYSWFLWDSAGGDSTANFLLVHQQRRLIIIEAGSAGVITTSSTYLDLDDVKSGTSKGTLDLARVAPLQFSKVKGHVVITSEAIDPTLVRYDVDAETISFTKLDLKVRDTIGLESGIEVDKRAVLVDFPVGDDASATFPTITENHEYNLYNQGWYQHRRNTVSTTTAVDPISYFITRETDAPSNSDIAHLASTINGSGVYILDSELLQDLTLGTSLAPRGHYVFNAFDFDRDNRLGAVGKDISGAYTGGGGPAGGVNFGDWTFIPGSV